MNLPRWSIWLIDTGIVAFSIILAHLLRFNFEVSNIDYFHFWHGPFILWVLRVLSFFVFKTYTGIIFHTGIEDARRIFLALASISVIWAFILNPLSYLWTEHYLLPFSILIIELLVSVFSMAAYRALFKIIYIESINQDKEVKRVFIYGAGSAGVTVKQVLDRDMATNYDVIAFIDDNESLQKKRLLGVEILSGKNLENLLAEKRPDMLIFSTFSIPPERKQEVVEWCLQHQVQLLNVPPVDRWINGELSFRQIREIRIEDLLEREPIQLDEANISAHIKGKTVLISGAAGSIGSEIVRQCLHFHPRRLLLLDQAETPLHELDLELNNQHHFAQYEIILGDVRNDDRMRRLFEVFKPEVVYHAAAYKHVPMMEHNPSEAILTNVKGTKVIADLAVEYEVEKFVLVSTDKAVNPSSIMGASKRIAEIYVQSLDRHLQKENTNHTRFITTRFGNVLGSNGSVIPLFKKQIASGGPVTVTHPEMTRFFMTIPEACQLVMEAAAMGQGGEIFVFDMGRSIRILDLAKRMVRLSGLELGKDIHIVFTGLRPGEKLYEELLNQAETTMPTHHQKILIAKVREYAYPLVEERVAQLVGLFGHQDNEAMVKLLKTMVPEFKSNNSVFEQLD